MDTQILDKYSDTPLYLQLQKELMNGISNGKAAPGDRLPTVAAFAKSYQVTQSTVRRALKDLVQEGWIESHVGRGTFVSATPGSISQSEVRPVPVMTQKGSRQLQADIGKTLESLQAIAKGPGIISFTAGTPDASLAREGILEDLVSDALTQGQDLLQSYGDPGGMQELREAISQRASSDSVKVDADQVLLTNGSQQAVALLAQYAKENAWRVLCETPCYMGVPDAFAAMGLHVDSIPRDLEGPILSSLELHRADQPGLLYLCHELHNPMGTNLDPDRQRTLIAWARREKVLLVGDEIFRDLNFDGPSPSTFFAEATADDAVLIGSLSKAFMCGLRVGYMISSRERIQSLTALKRAADISSPPLMEAIALALLESGAYDEHVKRARIHYQTRCITTLNALERHMPPGVEWTRPQGGFHMWVKLPEGYSSLALFLLAVKHGVEIVPGPRLDPERNFIRGFRLSYGSLSPDEIETGIVALGRAVNELLNQPSDTTNVGRFL